MTGVTERLGVVGRGEQFRLVVDLERVRLNVNAAIEELVKHRGRFLAFAHDFYWQAEPSMDEHPDPGDLMVASLADDYASVTWFDQFPDERRDFAPLVLHHLGSLLSVLHDLDPAAASADDVAASGQAK